jgi:hypothetical protein
MLLTLDHNCLIDFECGDIIRQSAMRQLVTLHEIGRVALQVSAISGSELQPGKRYATSFSEFQERLSRLAARSIAILRPMICLDVTFYDWCIWGGNEDSPEQRLERAIHTALFPRHEYSWADHAVASGVDPKAEGRALGPVLRDWRNRKCDVFAMWCHIYHGGDVFVTSDGHFHNPSAKENLVSLGAKRILRPTEVLSELLGC